MSVWLTIPKRAPRPVSVAVNCSSSVVGVPAESVARASRLTSPSRLTPRPSPTRNRPRATRPQEKWRPPRRTKIPPKYVVNPRMVRTTFSRNWGKEDGSPAYGRMYVSHAVRIITTMFCVECGAEGPTYEGLCAKDFAKKHAVVRAPEVVDVERCASCGSFRFRSGWSKLDRDLAATRLFRERIPAERPYERVTFTFVAREEDANNFSLTVKAVGRFQDLESVQGFRTRLRIKPSLCESCQKQRGRYYEGILQVRGEGRELTPAELRTIRTFVTARVDRGAEEGVCVSRTEEVHGGLDFYVSTNALGKNLARDIADAFGGSVSASPKLFGQKQGREVFRVKIGRAH